MLASENVGVARRNADEPTGITAPLAGALSATERVAVLTLTFTAVDVAVFPAESVTLAVSANKPVDGGVHDTEYGEENTVPIGVVLDPTKNSTLFTTPPPAVAVAVIVVGILALTVAPLVGLVIETVGVLVDADTLTAVDVTTAPFESVTRAVSEIVPVVVGVH